MDKKRRPLRHRLSMDIPDEVMNIIREVCDKQDITITRYVLRCISRQINLETGNEVKYKKTYCNKER